MQVKTTVTVTNDLVVSREGDTVGTIVDNIIRDCVEGGQTVSSVSVTVSEEDWIALKLLKAPAHHAHEVGKHDGKIMHGSKTLKTWKDNKDEYNRSMAAGPVNQRSD